jgi:uncharacterized protein (TIGR02266 family)
MTQSQQPAPPRAFARLPYNLLVNFGGLATFYSGFAVNLSTGGLRVATCAPPAKGVRFAAEFELDTQHTVRAPVEVVWTRYVSAPDKTGKRVSEMGLRFLNLMPDDRAAIERMAEATPRSSQR